MPKIKQYTLVLRGILKDSQGRFLLLQRAGHSKSWPGRWEFPGGKVDQGEDIGHALVREWEEETGLDVKPGPFVAAFEWEREKDKIIYFVFHVTTGSKVVRISSEHDAFGWFTREQMQGMDVSPSLLTLVRTLS